MKTKQSRKLSLSRETLRTLQGQEMKALVVGGSGCPTCADASCETCWSCDYTCYASCTGSCFTCDHSCPCI